MIQTSYFGKAKNLPNTVAICTGIPEWYKGEIYTDLAPGWSIVKEYKRAMRDNSACECIYQDHYRARYNFEILRKLDPQKVYDDLNGKILLCYERKGLFCHRHLVADWLYESLGVEVEELN